MDLLDRLNKELKRSTRNERQRVLQGVYKQLVTSNAGNQSNGIFRNAVNRERDDRTLALLSYVGL